MSETSAISLHRGYYCTMLQCFLDKTFVFQISGEGETQTGGGRERRGRE